MGDRHHIHRRDAPVDACVTAARPLVLTLILLSAFAHDSQQRQAAQQPEGPPPNGRDGRVEVDMAQVNIPPASRPPP